MDLSLSKATSFLIILLLVIGSTSVFLVFQTRDVAHRNYFSIECEEGSSTRIIDNATLGQFNFTTAETNRSYSFLFDFQEEYEQEYTHENLSFKLDGIYWLGDGYYSINESVCFGVVAPILARSWNSSDNWPPGFLKFEMPLENSNYTYAGVPHGVQELHILWAFNITSTKVPKDNFLCILNAEFSDIETSDGLSSTTSTTVTVALWVIGLLVLVELNRKRPSKPLSRKISG